MRPPPLPFLLAFMAVLLTPPATAQTNFATLATDGAWTWFNDPRAIFHNAALYFGYVRSSDGRSTLSLFNLQSGQTTNLWTSSLTQVDDHDDCGLLSKQDGTLFANYSRHQNDQFFTYRLSTSTNPVSPADWGGEQTNNTGMTVGSGMTYSNPFQLTNESGTLYNFGRYINYNPNVFTSTDGGATWSTPQVVIQTGSGSTRPYVKYCSDYNARIDLLYTDAHPDNYTNSLYHLYYQGGAFYKTDGTFIRNFASLPILHDSGERGSVVYQYSDAASSDLNQWIATARAWCWEIGYQTNGYPVCVFQVKVDNVTGSNWFDARIYYYYARWTGSAWQKRFIAQAGRPLYNGQPDYGGGIGLDPMDVNTIYMSSDAANPFDLTTTTNVPLANHYEIWKGVTSDGGLTFNWQAVTTNSTVDNLRPYVPRRFGGEPCVLWFRGTYVSYTSFTAAIVGLFTTQVPVPIVITNPPPVVPMLKKANNANNMNLTNSWVSGVVPGAGDIALWDSTVTAANTVALGGNLSWSGLSVTNPGGAVAITSGNTLTLGNSGVDMSGATADLAINSGVTIAPGDQAWNVTAGRTLTLNTGTFTRSAGATLNLQGSGTVSSAMTGLNATDASTPAPGIIGAWATSGTGASAAYATTNAGNLVAYTAATVPTGTTPGAWGDIPSGGTGTTNYDLTNSTAVTFGFARSVNTARHLAGATTVTIGNSSSSISFAFNGLMNAGSGTLTFVKGGTGSTTGVAVGTRNEFVLNAANAPITISAPIINNGANASSITIVGANSNAVTFGAANTYTGGTTVNSGNLTLGNALALGSTSGALAVNGGALDLGALTTVTVGPVTISGGSVQNGTLTGSSYTANIPNGATVSASLAGASATLTKSGPGTLTLFGANSYANATTVLSGTLNCNGSISTGPVIITGGALGGTGTISGMVTVQSGGVLAPGNNGIGALTINNALTNTGTVSMRLNKSGATLANSTIKGVSLFSISGVLSVTNLGSEILTVGDSFKLFYATNLTGAFATIVPPTPGPGLVWDTNNLSVSGILAVGLGTFKPQIKQVSILETNLVLSGSNGAAGVSFSIIASTNLALRLTNWGLSATGVFDRNANFAVTNFLSPQTPRKFYAIRVP